MRRQTEVVMILALGLSPLAGCLPAGGGASQKAAWQADGLPTRDTLLGRVVPQRFLGPKAAWSAAGPGLWTATAGEGLVLTARDAPTGAAAGYTLSAAERPASIDKGSPIRNFVVAALPPHLASEAEAAAHRLQIFSDASEPAQAAVGGLVFSYTPAGAGYRVDVAASR
ncbi:hypothetical protein [Caulobacter hibisci]|uniref:Uncharacterized protein n=1 Tax=Caulobacter hibisci TaxID=2035993 RepID=A0ABS0ST53_9CAUL|nr:hypothetical protein [Caulobacter hibisci]MBI1682529.1 hypothetical protein [Caulobacter hibisci]